jgi:gamma-glutamyltranspeptidase/glutathione hydrolase
VDAAIAASAVLSVVYPHMTSIGGDQFWLIWDARRRAVRFLNAGGRAAASGTLEWFGSRGLDDIPMRGISPRHPHHARLRWTDGAKPRRLGRLPLARDLARPSPLSA